MVVNSGEIFIENLQTASSRTMGMVRTASIAAASSVQWFNKPLEDYNPYTFIPCSVLSAILHTAMNAV